MNKVSYEFERLLFAGIKSRLDEILDAEINNLTETIIQKLRTSTCEVAMQISRGFDYDECRGKLIISIDLDKLVIGK